MHRILFSLLLAASAVAPLAAQENLFIQVPKATHPEDRSRIEAEALFSIPPPSGFLPVRVEMINQREREASARFSSKSIHRSGVGGDSEMTSGFQIEAPPRTTVTRDLLVPVATCFESSGSYQNYSVTVSLSGGFGNTAGTLGGEFDPTRPTILLSEALHTPNAGALDAALNATAGARYGSPSFAARYTPTKMPEDWRAYSGYDVLIATDRDWLAMTPGARNAILQWCRLGRELAIYRIGEGDTGFGALDIDIDTAGEDSADDRASYGLGTIALERIDAALDLPATATVARYHGSPEIDPLVPAINRDFSNNWPLHEKFGARDFEYGLFIVVLIAFGILVGPVNLFVFAKSGQRHKLFITTPIISVATSILLIFLILFKDGLGGHGMTVGLMEVRPDAGENRAYLIQEQVSRTGVLIGGSFELGEAAAITPVPLAPGDWSRLTTVNGGADMRYTARPEGDRLAVSGDWFKSRSEQGQLVQAVIPTRGRLELQSDAGTPAFTSTFNHPLDAVYYIDANRDHWRAENLRTGTAAKCVPISPDAYRQAIDKRAGQLGQRQAELLRRASRRAGHFVAVTDDAPPVPTFTPIRWKAHTTIITGPPAR